MECNPDAHEAIALSFAFDDYGLDGPIFYPPFSQVSLRTRSTDECATINGFCAVQLWLHYIDGGGLGHGSDSDSKLDGYIVQYCTETASVAQTQTWIPTPYFCIGQESESVPGNVKVPLEVELLG